MTGKIFQFSWKNIWRNKRRTYLTLLAITFSVMAVVFTMSYISGVVHSSTEEMIKMRIGHIRIAHEKFLGMERILPREYLVTPAQSNQIQDAVSRVPGVELFLERIKFHVLLSRQGVNESAVAVGIEPQKTDKIMQLSKAMVEGNYNDFSHSNQALNLIIGKQLARKLNVAINDELLLVTTDINYSTYALPFKIVGIFQTGYTAMDKYLLFIPLEKAREMLDCGTAFQDILIFLKDPAAAINASETIRQILTKNRETNLHLQVSPWQQDEYVWNFIPYLDEIVEKVLGIIMLLLALVILNTMLMAVTERYHEIGVLKALGVRDGEVRFMIIVEAFFIGTIGSVVGGILGGIISAITEKTGIDVTQMMGEGIFEKLDLPLPVFGRVLYPDFDISIFINAVIFGIFVAIMAVLYPAFKSSKMSPVETFRSRLKV